MPTHRLGQYLNSTVILLILMQLIPQSISLKHLNSTVILLIWFIQNNEGVKQSLFKFHCDSINIENAQVSDDTQD